MKVLVTGIGCVSAIGLNVNEHLHAFSEKKSGMGPITLFPTTHTEPVGEVKLSNSAMKASLGLPERAVISRTALLGMLAAREAFKDAYLSASSDYRIGLISATSTGGMDLSEQFYQEYRKDSTRGNLHDIVSHDPGDSTERIAALLDIKDFRTTISTACSSAANAIMLGARLIRQGKLDIVIAGGTDALSKFTLNGFGSLLLLDKMPCRPFDATRAGLNLGEGAGYLVLQSDRVPRVNEYCSLVGYANANDAFHQTASSADGNGAYLAMKGALAKAKLKPGDIHYINAHGTGTPNNDASESAAIRRLFGEHIPPFSSTKAYTGHTLGAAGGLEAVFSVLSLYHEELYPNLNFSQPIPETGLVPVTEYNSSAKLRNVLSNSCGFGGNNTSLVFHK